MTKLFKPNDWLFIIISLIYLIVNGILMSFDFFYFNLLPIIVIIIWLAIKSIDKLVFLVILFVPLSVPLSEFVHGLPINMFMPTEPLLAGMLLLFVLLLPTGKLLNKEVLNHPVTKVIALQLAWILITSFTSTMPIVSIKYFIMRTWFVVAFYYIITLSINKIKDINKIIWLYSVPMVIVIAYAITRHLTYGIFNKKIAHWASNPFFNDHTVYGATLAIFIPFLAYHAFKKSNNTLLKIFQITIFSVFLIALYFSYSRAAWLSVIIALIVYFIIKFKINAKVILLGVLVGVIGISLMWNRIVINLETNKTDSSVTNISKQVKSMTNISSDASNLERFNRWKCALRMFKDKPLFGFGPGTYMFKYAPYQFSYEKTIISTNAGDMGNAHSEYLGPLAESGILGILTMLLLIITVSVVAIRLYFRIDNKELKSIILSAYLGLVTYYIHGILNDFLDTDKISVPFWAFTAFIVAIDLYGERIVKNSKEITD